MRPRPALSAVAAAAAALVLCLSTAGCGSTGISAAPLSSSMSHAFAHLYVLDQVEQGNPRPVLASLRSRASCLKDDSQAVTQQGSGIWLCQVTYQVTGGGPVIAKYNVDVQTDGCYAADGDGPTTLNGYPTITGPHDKQVNNPLFLIDACFDTT